MLSILTFSSKPPPNLGISTVLSSSTLYVPFIEGPLPSLLHLPVTLSAVNSRLISTLAPPSVPSCFHLPRISSAALPEPAGAPSFLPLQPVCVRPKGRSRQTVNTRRYLFFMTLSLVGDGEG